MKRQLQINEQRHRHHAALAALANSLNPYNKLSGLQLWRKLRRLEIAARSAACAQCNGEGYGGQPYRETEAWETFKAETGAKVAAIFGGKLPPAFFVNGDPRGYVLKLDSGNGEKAATEFPLHRDWGNNQILAPVIE